MRQVQKIFISGMASLAVLVLGVQAQAGSYQFTPFPTNLGNLPHQYYYSWGVQWAGPDQSEQIDSISLNISKINNWQQGSDNVLHIWLVDSLPANVNWVKNNWPGISYGLESPNSGQEDVFASSGGTLLMNYSDTNGRRTEDLEISIPVDILTQYISNDGIFGIALDPDCHYYNKGMCLTIDTSLTDAPNNGVPEPVTMTGIVCGLGVLAGYWRKRKQAERITRSGENHGLRNI